MRQLYYPSTVNNTCLGVVSSTAYPAGAVKSQFIVLSDNLAFVMGGAGYTSVTVYNISNPASPTVVTQVNAGNNSTFGAVVLGNYLYWGGGLNAYIMQIAPTPTLTSTTTLSSVGLVANVAAYGNYMYLSTALLNLVVLNTTNKAAPSQTYQEGGSLTNRGFGVCIGQANTLYTTSFDVLATHSTKYLKTWDISSPGAPVLTNTYTFINNTKPQGIVFYNNTIFVTDAVTGRYIIVDVTNPNAPVELSTMQASGTSILSGNVPSFSTTMPGKTYAYLASGANVTTGSAIDIYDITTLSSPVLVKTIWNNIASSISANVVVNDTYVYRAEFGAAAGTSGTLDIYNNVAAYSTSIPSANILDVSAQSLVTDASTLAQVRLQGSNDATNPVSFTDIPATVTTITNAANSVLIPKTYICYQYVRLAYSTLGTGTTANTIKALGD